MSTAPNPAGALLRRGLEGLLVVAVPLALAASLLSLFGYAPGRAARGLIDGTLGSPERFLSVVLVRACPLMLTGLSVALSFRAGIFNIGAEGQLYLGALAAAYVGIHAGALAGAALPALLLAGAAGGAAWAAIPALLRLRFRVPEVIATLMLNFVAELLIAYAVHGPLMEARRTYPQTDPIGAGARLPLLPPTRLHAGLLLALAAGIGLFVLLRWTVFGFRLRVAGLNPRAARVAGRFEPARVQFLSFVLAGALAGAAGAIEVAGVTYVLYEKLSPGYGYTALAVALLARLEPLGVLLSAVFFGLLEGGASAMQRFSGVPAVLVYVVEALILLSVLVSERLLRRAPA